MKAYASVFKGNSIIKALKNQETSVTNTLKQELESIEYEGDDGSTFDIYEITLKKVKTVKILRKLEEVKP